jgi:hypothetical protein
MIRRHRWPNRARTRSFLGILILGWTNVHARAQESWDAVYLGGAKTGHIHTFVEKVKDHGRDYLRVRIDIEHRAKRRDDVAVTKLMYGTIETPDEGRRAGPVGARRRDQRPDGADPGP